MQKVTKNQLASILYNLSFIKGMPLFASVLQFTEPKCKKTGNPYKSIMKFSKVSILLNSDYEKAVTNQLVKEDKDKTEYQKGKNTMPLVFGENNNFIGLFNGEYVLQYRPNDNSVPHTKYIADGKLVDKKKIENFLPAVYAATNQGTEREIFWRKLYLSNIRKITINKETYKIVADN